jgi:hypothetical protein
MSSSNLDILVFLSSQPSGIRSFVRASSSLLRLSDIKQARTVVAIRLKVAMHFLLVHVDL